MGRAAERSEGDGGHAAHLPTSTFAALRVPTYRRLWIAGLVVFMATNAQVIARGWLARELTGTNAGLGGVLLAFGVVMLVATPFGGVAADRLSKRTVIVVAQILLAASALWLGLAIAFDVVAYWMILGSSAVQALAFAVFGPARVAFIAELVPPGTLTNGIVLTQMSSEAMRVIGPTLAGLVIAALTWGLQAVFLVSGGLLLVGTLLTLALPPGRPSPGRVTQSPVAEITDGLRYVRARPELTLLVLTSLGVVMIGYPYMAFLPTVAQGVFEQGSAGYGVLSAASAVGALTAGLLGARRSGRFDPWRWVLGSGIGLGIGLVLLGGMPTFALATAVILVIGGMTLTFQTTTNSLLLNLSDFEYHGRIQSLVMLGYSGYGIAALPLGALADGIGLRPTFALMGVAVLVFMAAFLGRRRAYLEREAVLDLG